MTGPRPRLVLREILALDGVFPGSEPRLVHATGDLWSAEGYTATEAATPPGEALAFASRGGWPSDIAFPYGLLKLCLSGVTLAVGGPGQWSATFRGRADGIAVRGPARSGRTCDSGPGVKISGRPG